MRLWMELYIFLFCMPIFCSTLSIWKIWAVLLISNSFAFDPIKLWYICLYWFACAFLSNFLVFCFAHWNLCLYCNINSSALDIFSTELPKNDVLCLSWAGKFVGTSSIVEYFNDHHSFRARENWACRCSKKQLLV